MGEEQLRTELQAARQEIAARDAVIAAQTQTIQELRAKYAEPERCASVSVRTRLRRTARKLRNRIK